jgi:selenocysteine-specific elongation factor
MTIEQEQVIIGTAGHIDHGKTALVKALTGIDADTLAEEKKRGSTIELGFVFMDTPGAGKQIVFIDVPGHERLVKTMVAGASNIDAALLIVAVDEGVSAQTVEHLDILRLLNIEQGIIALTKSDLADKDRIRTVSADVANFVAGTFLEGVPIIPVSSVTGEGLEEIRSALMTVAGKVMKRQDSGVFRMPVDRVFTMQGFGTVIAGTILSGEVKVGDKIEILPDGIAAKVRGIQVHGESAQRSFIGRRTAVNLQDVKKEQLHRGQCACASGSVTPTDRLDVKLHLLKSCDGELKNGDRVRVHIGTDEAIGRIILLAGEKLPPGGECVAQFVLESPTTAVPKDRFVIRTFSPLKTIGGGVVLDAHPSRHKRFDEDAIESLEKLGSGITDTVEQAFLKSRCVPLGPAEVARAVGESEDDVSRAMDELAQAGKLIEVSGGKYIHARHFDDLADKLVEIINAYYAKEPYRLSMPISDLQSSFFRIADKSVLEAVLGRLMENGTIRKKGAVVGLANRAINWKSGEQEAADRIERVFRDAGYAAPLEEDVRAQVSFSLQAFQNIMTALIEQGKLVRLSENVTYHNDYLLKVKDLIVEHIKKQGGITAAELRDKLGLSRKYAIAILEYLDNIQFTRRDGDKRLLR